LIASQFIVSGGTLGLFVGMSLLSAVEALIWILSALKKVAIIPAIKR
jgi:hypothetical protein